MYAFKNTEGQLIDFLINAKQLENTEHLADEVEKTNNI